MCVCFRLWDGPTVLLAPAGHSFASYMRHEPPSLSGLGGGREFSSGYGSGGGGGQAAKEEGKQGQVPVLILHGSEDKTVDVDLSYQVSANWQADTTLCFLSGCPEPVLAYAQGFDQKIARNSYCRASCSSQSCDVLFSACARQLAGTHAGDSCRLLISNDGHDLSSLCGRDLFLGLLVDLLCGAVVRNRFFLSNCIYMCIN
jgi:hypothetical protein